MDLRNALFEVIYSRSIDKVNGVISIIADDIERTNVGDCPDVCQAVLYCGTRYDSYLKGARDEHAYIVEYLRGLLDN